MQPCLEARLPQDSSNSSRPPFTDSPETKRHRQLQAAERRKSGGKRGHPGHPQVLLEPPATVALFPEGCSWGHRELVALPPYHTHQVIKLPVIRPDVTHWLLHQGQCLPWRQALLADHPPRCQGRQNQDVGPPIGAGRRIALGVSGHPGCGSNA